MSNHKKVSEKSLDSNETDVSQHHNGLIKYAANAVKKEFGVHDDF
jgi:hypothetical protein